MKVHAGFYGMKQYEDLSLEPAIALAVRDQDGSEANHENPRNYTEIAHRDTVYWSPEVFSSEDLEVFASYGSFDSLQTDAQLKNVIRMKIGQHPVGLSDELAGKSIQLLISSKGTVLECQGEGMDQALLNEILIAVQGMPEKWNPAKADFRKINTEYYNEDDDGKILPIPANSWVKVQF